MLLITAELKRVLKKTGTMWWNHGDSYGGSGMGLSYAGQSKGPNSILPDKTLASMPMVAHTRGRYEKSLLLQNYRLIIRMIDDDRDDIYELRKDAPEWVKKELTKKGLL